MKDKKYWIISRLLFDKVWDHSLFEPRDILTDKQILLYDKNAMKYYVFKNPVISLEHYGYIAERNYCPRYFKKVVKPFVKDSLEGSSDEQH